MVVSGWVDMDGQLRTQGGCVDIGADESDGRTWSVVRPIVRVTTDGNDGNDGSSWALAKRTIQAAIAGAASEGGEVWVAAGTYHERIVVPQYVYVYGGFSGTEGSESEREWRRNATVIDAQQAGTVVTFERAGHLLGAIDGFTIRNGTGSGIRCSHASPSIENNTVTSNYAGNYGGGIYLSYSSAVVTNNTIAGNVAQYYGGGGIFCHNSSALIANNVISANTTGSAGGGIFCYYNGLPKVTNNTIVGNVAQHGGGGILVDGWSSPLIANNVVAFNSSGVGSGREGLPSLRHNCVYGNWEYDYLGLSSGEGDI
jgi:parallel beta-helix repeat protein